MNNVNNNSNNNSKTNANVNGANVSINSQSKLGASVSAPVSSSSVTNTILQSDSGKRVVLSSRATKVNTPEDIVADTVPLGGLGLSLQGNSCVSNEASDIQWLNTAGSSILPYGCVLARDILMGKAKVPYADYKDPMSVAGLLYSVIPGLCLHNSARPQRVCGLYVALFSCLMLYSAANTFCVLFFLSIDTTPMYIMLLSPPLVPIFLVICGFSVLVSSSKKVARAAQRFNLVALINAFTALTLSLIHFQQLQWIPICISCGIILLIFLMMPLLNYIVSWIQYNSDTNKLRVNYLADSLRNEAKSNPILNDDNVALFAPLPFPIVK
jgi:hypothetical protein